MNNLRLAKLGLFLLCFLGIVGGADAAIIPLKTNYIRPTEVTIFPFDASNPSKIEGRVIGGEFLPEVKTAQFSLRDMGGAEVWSSTITDIESMIENGKVAVPFAIDASEKKLSGDYNLSLNLLDASGAILFSGERMISFPVLDAASDQLSGISGLQVGKGEKLSVAFSFQNRTNIQKFSGVIDILEKTTGIKVATQKSEPQLVGQTQSQDFYIETDIPQIPGTYLIEASVVGESGDTVTGKLEQPLLIDGDFANIQSVEIVPGEILKSGQDATLVIKGTLHRTALPVQVSFVGEAGLNFSAEAKADLSGDFMVQFPFKAAEDMDSLNGTAKVMRGETLLGQRNFGKELEEQSVEKVIEQEKDDFQKKQAEMEALRQKALAESQAATAPVATEKEVVVEETVPATTPVETTANVKSLVFAVGGILAVLLLVLILIIVEKRKNITPPQMLMALALLTGLLFAQTSFGAAPWVQPTGDTGGTTTTTTTTTYDEVGLGCTPGLQTIPYCEYDDFIEPICPTNCGYAGGTVVSSVINPNCADPARTRICTPHQGGGGSGGYVNWTKVCPATAACTCTAADWNAPAACPTACGQPAQVLTGTKKTGVVCSGGVAAPTTNCSATAPCSQTCGGISPTGGTELIKGATTYTAGTPTTWTYNASTVANVTQCSWACISGYHSYNNTCVSNNCGGVTPVTGDGMIFGAATFTTGPAITSWTYDSAVTPSVCKWTCDGTKNFIRDGAKNACVCKPDTILSADKTKCESSTNCTGATPGLNTEKGPSTYSVGYTPTEWTYDDAAVAPIAAACKWKCQEGYTPSPKNDNTCVNISLDWYLPESGEAFSSDPSENVDPNNIYFSKIPFQGRIYDADTNTGIFVSGTTAKVQFWKEGNVTEVPDKEININDVTLIGDSDYYFEVDAKQLKDLGGKVTPKVLITPPGSEDSFLSEVADMTLLIDGDKPSVSIAIKKQDGTSFTEGEYTKDPIKVDIACSDGSGSGCGQTFSPYDLKGNFCGSSEICNAPAQNFQFCDKVGNCLTQNLIIEGLYDPEAPTGVITNTSETIKAGTNFPLSFDLVDPKKTQNIDLATNACGNGTYYKLDANTGEAGLCVETKVVCADSATRRGIRTNGGACAADCGENRTVVDCTTQVPDPQGMCCGNDCTKSFPFCFVSEGMILGE